MDIYFYGQACFKLKGKTTSVVIDPYDPEFVGLKLPKLEADIVLTTHTHEDHNNVSAVKTESGDTPFVIAGPGEYEKSGVAIVGVNSFHDASNGSERGRNTMYCVTIDEVKVAHLGDLGQEKLTDEQMEELGSVDVLLIPVGGTFTIDAKKAAAIVAQIEPKIIIPMHYLLPGLKFQLDPADNFLKEMGIESKEEIAKLSISRDKIPEETQVVMLAKQG